MRQLTAAVTVAAIAILVAGCGGGDKGGSASSSSATTTTTPSPSKPPLAQPALASLVLNPAEIDTALGVTGAKVTETSDALTEDTTASTFSPGYKLPAECLYAYAAGLAPIYAGSGNTAVHRERDVMSLPPDSHDPDPQVHQVVVLFPSAKEANAFFANSSKAWPACANRQDTAPGDANNPEIRWSVGPVSTANGTLSTSVGVTVTPKNGTSTSASCQRALTVRNNVVIDIEACRKDPGDVAVNVAGQIAGRVDKQ